MKMILSPTTRDTRDHPDDNHSDDNRSDYG